MVRGELDGATPLLKMKVGDERTTLAVVMANMPTTSGISTPSTESEKRQGGGVCHCCQRARWAPWTPNEQLWAGALQDLDVTVFGGGVIVDATGYDNVMLELSGRHAVVRYRERMPVPVSM